MECIYKEYHSALKGKEHFPLEQHGWNLRAFYKGIKSDRKGVWHVWDS